MPRHAPSRNALLAGMTVLACALAFSGARCAEPAAATPPIATVPPPVPPVGEVVRQAVARDDLRRLHRTAFECDQTTRTQRLDSTTGKVLTSKTVQAVFRPTANIAFSANVEANGASSASGNSHVNEDTVKAQKIMAVMNLGKLAPRFLETITGSAVIQGRPCYIVRFRPIPGQPSDSREEKVVNNVSGRFWIAKDNFDIMQSEGSLVGPVTVALIASVTRMDFTFHSLTLPNGEVGPAEFSVDMAVKAPFYDFRQIQTNSMANWRAAEGH